MATFIVNSATVQFYDRSALRATSWLWDFGDGGTSTDRNPLHTYAFAGTYNVTLVVTCEGQMSEITFPVIVDFPPVTPTLDFTTFASDQRLASMIGYSEFTSVSSPPRTYRRRQFSGALAQDRLYASASCVGVYPGGGTQTGEFPVFWFFNEFAIGHVSLSSSVDSGVATVVQGAADWVNRDPPFYLNRASTPWSYGISGRPASVNNPGYTFTCPAGTIITAYISIQAISGFGIGAWNYEAGRATFTDAWSQFWQYDPVTSALTSGGGATRTIPGDGPITLPDNGAGDVAAGRPSAYYVPASTLIVQIEPTYISTTTERVARDVDGLACCVGTGFGPASLLSVGTITEALIDEDLEVDAIARAAPTISNSNVARYEARSGLTFNYRVVAIDVSCNNLAAGSNYIVTVPTVEENYGGGSPVYDAITYTFTASGSTHFVSDVITADRGKQLTLGTPTIAYA